MKAINDLRRHCDPLRPLLESAFAAFLDSGHFILGAQVKGFEEEFAAACGVGHCVSVANGTDAIEIALRSCGVQAGDRVVTVANAGLYATTAIRSIGAIPVYVEVRPDTGLVDLDDLRSCCGRFGPRAVVATHLYGRMVPMPDVLRIAADHAAVTIEDCAQAHGAMLEGRPAGSWGDVGCFSFYPTKNLGALGDAGAIVTGSEALATAARRLRQYGWSGKYDAELAHGRNSRLDELQAAILRLLLPKLAGWNERRRAIAGGYGAGIRHPDVRPLAGSGPAYVAHLYVVRTNRRDALRRHLAARGIPSDVHYPIPDHRQRGNPGDWLANGLAVTDQLAAEVVTLPCFPEMTDDEVASVVDGVNTWAS